jgi:hypothetical protein
MCDPFICHRNHTYSPVSNEIDTWQLVLRTSAWLPFVVLVASRVRCHTLLDGHCCCGCHLPLPVIGSLSQKSPKSPIGPITGANEGNTAQTRQLHVINTYSVATCKRLGLEIDPVLLAGGCSNSEVQSWGRSSLADSGQPTCLLLRLPVEPALEISKKRQVWPELMRAEPEGKYSADTASLDTEGWGQRAAKVVKPHGSPVNVHCRQSRQSCYGDNVPNHLLDAWWGLHLTDLALGTRQSSLKEAPHELTPDRLCQQALPEGVLAWLQSTLRGIGSRGCAASDTGRGMYDGMPVSARNPVDSQPPQHFLVTRCFLPCVRMREALKVSRGPDRKHAKVLKLLLSRSVWFLLATALGG